MNVKQEIKRLPREIRICRKCFFLKITSYSKQICTCSNFLWVLKFLILYQIHLKANFSKHSVVKGG